MKTFGIVFLVVLAMVQLMARPSEAITCSQVDSALAPCISYLTRGGTPSNSCCDGVRSMKSMTPITADRQVACGCLKAAAVRYKAIKDSLASTLPQKCGVQINIPISRSTDCNRVN